MPDSAISTLVMLHDLRGFGAAVSTAGGTLDSPIGQAAYERILTLRNSLQQASGKFPQGTSLFHFNDSAVAVCDISYAVNAMHTEPRTIVGQPSTLPDDAIKDAIEFLSAAATLHQNSIQAEEVNKIGHAGRTFVVLGKRWALPVLSPSAINEFDELQANLAFSEAYAADTAGSKAGFDGRVWENIYVNDHLWYLFDSGRYTLTTADQLRLDKLGPQGSGRFPKNLLATRSPKEIELEIFHRPRKFYSLMSHHCKDLKW